MKIKKPSKVEISGVWPYAIVRISPGMKVELIDETATPEEAATGLRSIAAWLEKQVASGVVGSEG